MFTVVIISPVRKILGQWLTQEKAEFHAACFAINNGNTECWIFDPQGNFIQ